MKKLPLVLVLIGLFIHAFANRTATDFPEQFPSIVKRDTPRRAEVLFLGHDSEHHYSARYAPWLAIKLFKSGINLTYTTDLDDLNTENLSKYDALIIYANYSRISTAQEEALKGFVEGGKGLIPLHAASDCFRNSAWYTEAVGGRFSTHKTGKFKSTIVNHEHPIMQHIPEFETWDETYVHQDINPDMTVLTERVEGDHHEPYTWIREQGKGRVFYTAYGHNDSTWTNLQFLDLVNNGVKWALGENVRQLISQFDIPDVDIYDSDTISDYTRRYDVPDIQPALSPEESMKLSQVPVDFEIELFAAEPDITNPIAMAWDERGRLWIVESVDYPNTFVETDGAANDRIKICEDTDGDGKADKFTIFADSLNIPTSIVFANGGIIVSQAPHFVFMKDTDGDDKADVREILFSGWGKNDTHAGPSNLLYGFDNKIWGVVGYSGFDGTINSTNVKFRQGVYHLNPDGSDFEFLATTTNNTWGLGFSEDNHIFISTANGIHSTFYSMPEKLVQRPLPAKQVPAANSGTGIAGLTQTSTFQAVQSIQGHTDSHTLTPNIRQVDNIGGFTSAAGHQLYTARNFPKAYWNRIAFVNEPSVRLIHSAVIEPDGAGFAEKDGWNLFASSDEWAGPVQASVGPDGAVWVADWYSFLIQHNLSNAGQPAVNTILPPLFTQQPKWGQGNAFVSPLRDQDRGRIYRIVYKNAKPYDPVELSPSNTASLIAALKNDNMFWRMTAQRLLVEGKKVDAIPELYTIINNQQVDEIGLNSPAVHALWTLHGLGALDGSDAMAIETVARALSHPAAGVRKAALEVLPKSQTSLQYIKQHNSLADANLNVRMTALLTIAALPESDEAGKLLYEATLDSANEDEWVSRALLAAVLKHTAGFVAAMPDQTNAESPSERSLGQRIFTAISEEHYALGVTRRGRTYTFSPDVTGKTLVIKGAITAQNSSQGQGGTTAAPPAGVEGIIAAQGGKNNGYAVYLQDGKIIMLVNQEGKAYAAVSDTPLPASFDFSASLGSNGAITVEVDGKQVASAQAPGLFTTPLVQALRTGADEYDDRVGDYPETLALSGGLVRNATMELQKPEE